MRTPLHRRTEKIGACLADPFANGEGRIELIRSPSPKGAGGGCIDLAAIWRKARRSVNPKPMPAMSIALESILAVFREPRSLLFLPRSAESQNAKNSTRAKSRPLYPTKPTSMRPDRHFADGPEAETVAKAPPAMCQM
jgi:hypothetical protein